MPRREFDRAAVCADRRGKEDADAADDAGAWTSRPLRSAASHCNRKSKPRRGHLDARHEGCWRREAVEPDAGEVAAHHRQRQRRHAHGAKILRRGESRTRAWLLNLSGDDQRTSSAVATADERRRHHRVSVVVLHRRMSPLIAERKISPATCTADRRARRRRRSGGRSTSDTSPAAASSAWKAGWRKMIACATRARFTRDATSDNCVRRELTRERLLRWMQAQTPPSRAPALERAVLKYLCCQVNGASCGAGRPG